MLCYLNLNRNIIISKINELCEVDDMAVSWREKNNYNRLTNSTC